MPRIRRMRPGLEFALLAMALTMLFAGKSAVAVETIQEEEGSTCLVCHGDIAGTLEESVHSRFDLGCVDCHGGDDTAVKWEDAMNPAKGFKGKFTPKEVLFLCSKCHGDFERMRQFGIPIDQLQQYMTSEHGKSLFLTGNDKVAVCTSCHGVHDIRKVTDPESHVHPSNVPDTCGKCHSNEKLMKQFGIPSNIVDEYKKGVHGQRLLQMDLAAPVCSTCHGNHGAAPPGIAEVVNICGNCHQNIREEFKKSRHYKKGLECINCHNNHNNSHPTEAIFTSEKGGCRRCHPDPKSRQGKYISTVLEDIEKAETELKAAQENIEKAEHAGFYVDNEKVLLQEGHTAFLQFANVQHTLSISKVDKTLTTAASKAFNVKENVRIKFKSITDRRIVMGCVAAYLMFLILLIFMKYKRLHRAYIEERGKKA